MPHGKGQDIQGGLRFDLPVMVQSSSTPRLDHLPHGQQEFGPMEMRYAGKLLTWLS